MAERQSHLIDLAPLRASPAYARLWAASTLTGVGAWVTITAVALHIYALTQSTFAVSLVAWYSLVPMILAGLYGGAIADRFEQQISSADDLSDQRHDKAQEAAELQARLDRLEQRGQQQRDLEALAQENDGALTVQRQDWDRQIARVGLPGLPLPRVETWRAARERVLRAAEALEEDRARRDAFARQVTAASLALAQALGPLAPDGDAPGLAALLRLAEEVVTSARKAADKREPVSYTHLTLPTKRIV